MGGITEVAVSREAVSGAVFQDSSEIVDFLQKRVSIKDLAKHVIKEISNNILTKERKKKEMFLKKLQDHQNFIASSSYQTALNFKLSHVYAYVQNTTYHMVLPNYFQLAASMCHLLQPFNLLN